MAKQIKFHADARDALKRGIDKLFDAVSMTLGPRGRAAVIEKGYGAPQVTFDGVTVAKEVELEDKYENLGADFIKQAAEKTNDKVGDGTTTAVILAHAMMDEGEKIIREKGFNVIHLADELQKGAQIVIAGLEKQKEDINDPKKIQEVATLSAKNNEIGELIARVMSKVGKDGVVTVEDSNTISNSYEIVEGMQFDRGYISQYMVTNQERMEAVYDRPSILITDRKISSLAEILPILEKLAESGKKDLVIIADEVEGEALATLVVNKLRGIFNSLALKAPGFGDRRKEMLEDIATLIGGKVISEEVGLKLDKIELSDLGQADKVISTKENTTIVSGKGDKNKITSRIAQIKTQLKETTSEFDKDKLKERLGKLAGGVAVIKVGAATESAQKELKQRVEDAVSATRAAMEQGVVPGGGIALYNVVPSLKQKNAAEENDVESAAINILMNAISAPFRAIVQNSGQKWEDIESKVRARKTPESNYWIGFNALTNEVENLKEAGIMDPLKVTKEAFLNAVSVAGNYLKTGAALTEIPEKKNPSGPMPQMGEY